MTSLFLSEDEIAYMTGYKKQKFQVQWLSNEHIPHRVSKDGRPIVARSCFESINNHSLPLIKNEEEQPNFEALNGQKTT